jgi:Zn-dependent peptidase ImmA (M78 family)
MAKVAVKESILRWAVERSKRSPDAFLPKFPHLRDWEEGIAMPTLHQLEQLATATHTPLGYFFLEKPPTEALPIPHFRTLVEETPNDPSPDLLETVYSMQRRQDWMREFLIAESHAPLPFVGRAKPSDSPEVLARTLRTILGFADGWAVTAPNWAAALRKLQHASEQAGILVAVSGIVGNNTRRKLDPAEFRGFVLVDDYAPLVFLNGADGKAAQMFTLAHELAHVLFGSSAAFDLRQMAPAQGGIERACNRLAAEFLVPAEQLRVAWLQTRSQDDPWQFLARQFKVSEIVAARRALDLKLIGHETFREFYETYIRMERKKPKGDGGDFYLTQSSRLGGLFGTTVARAVREGRLLYTEAYELTGMRGKTFDNFISHLPEHSA